MTTLLEIVRERPTSPEALRRISGVGEKKLVNYGDAVLDIVAAESMKQKKEQPMRTALFAWTLEDSADHRGLNALIVELALDFRRL